MRRVAVLSAMEQEISAIVDRIADPAAHEFFGTTFVTGSLVGADVVAALTGFGKVGAAATTATVIDRFEPGLVLFAGVAGGVGHGVAIGDVVVADRLVQHDYDASPIYQPFVIPSLGVAEIPTDPDLTRRLINAVHRYVDRKTPGSGETAPKTHLGMIASGDTFISSLSQLDDLQRRLPAALAVEMEGAAVAQVCAERGMPFAVFRLISDRADATAAVDFLAFVSTVSAPFAAGIVEEFLGGGGWG